MRGCAIGGFRPVESESEVKICQNFQLGSKNLSGPRLSGPCLSGPWPL